MRICQRLRGIHLRIPVIGVSGDRSDDKYRPNKKSEPPRTTEIERRPPIEHCLPGPRFFGWSQTAAPIFLFAAALFPKHVKYAAGLVRRRFGFWFCSKGNLSGDGPLYL